MSGIVSAILPFVGPFPGAGQAIFPGLLNTDQTEFPETPVAENSTFDSQIESQAEKNRQLTRIANRKSRSLTSIQDNPIESDSLLQILAEGQ